MENDIKTILLVEDEHPIEILETRILKNAGYNVVTAKTGEEAIEIVNNNKSIDLILMDINLGPGMDGAESAREILKHHDIPIVFLSSHTEKEIVDKTDKITSYGYIVKSAGDTVLLASIKMAFRLHNEHKKIQKQMEEVEAYNNELQASMEELELTNRELKEYQEKLKEQEALLKESEARLKESQAMAHLGHWYWDLQKQTLTWSDEIFNIFGVSKETFEVSATNFEKTIHPDDLENFLREREKALNSNKSVDIVHRIIRPSGEIRYVHEKATIDRDENNKAIRVFGTVQDITDQIEIQESLQEKELIFKSFLEFSPIYVFFKDHNIRPIYLSRNYEKMIGMPLENILGKTMDELFPSDLAKSMIEDDKKIIHEGKLIHVDEELAGRYYTTIKFPITIPGKPTMLAGFTMDITEQKLKEEKINKLNDELKHRTDTLEAINKELQTFSYSVAHDLRSPLRVIEGYSKNLLDDYFDKLDENGKESINYIMEAIVKMDRLLNDLLKLSKVTSGQSNRKEVNISLIVESLLNELKKSEKERKVESIVAPDIIVNADEGLIKIVIDNLIGNAWKYTKNKPETKIEFGTINYSGETVYFIKDNGVGFDMKYANKLFIPFQRLHSDVEFEGSGIGLATVQRIIHHHGGRIWGEGKINEGAVFYFTLH